MWRIRANLMCSIVHQRFATCHQRNDAAVDSAAMTAETRNGGVFAATAMMAPSDPSPSTALVCQITCSSEDADAWQTSYSLRRAERPPPSRLQLKLSNT